jgi:hypothetical protein
MSDDLRLVRVDYVRASQPVTGIAIGRDLSLAIVLDGQGLKVFLEPMDAREMAARLLAIADCHERAAVEVTEEFAALLQKGAVGNA